MEWAYHQHGKEYKKKYYSYPWESCSIKYEICTVHDKYWKYWFGLYLKSKKVHLKSSTACKCKLDQTIIVNA